MDIGSTKGCRRVLPVADIEPLHKWCRCVEKTRDPGPDEGSFLLDLRWYSFLLLLDGPGRNVLGTRHLVLETTLCQTIELSICPWDGGGTGGSRDPVVSVRSVSGYRVLLLW